MKQHSKRIDDTKYIFILLNVKNCKKKPIKICEIISYRIDKIFDIEQVYNEKYVKTKCFHENVMPILSCCYVINSCCKFLYLYISNINWFCCKNMQIKLFTGGFRRYIVKNKKMIRFIYNVYDLEIFFDDTCLILR